MAIPTISVVVPTLNEVHTISKLLKDLLTQSLKPQEIIVVDGSSKDGTAKVARSFDGVTVITTPAGVGAQRNAGGEHARSEIVYFLDADVRLTSDFLANSLHEITGRRLDCACPHYRPSTQLLSVRFVFFMLNLLFQLGEKHFPAGAGPCIMVKRSVFKKLKGFRAELLVDDLDFVHRAGKAFSFGILQQSIFVSDRRFRKFGVFTTTLQYAQISWHFIRGKLRQTNSIKYVFGKFG